MALLRPPLLDDALELTTLLTPSWGEMNTGTLVCAGDPDPKDPDPKPDPKDDNPKDPDPKDDNPDDPDDKVTPDDDWKTKSRKNESRAKRLQRENEELERKLRDREDADKSEQEKALDKAREEARREALSEAEKERRGDRLELAVTRSASRGIKTGEDGKAVRFADPDDALARIERALAKGDIDDSDIFDEDGKVNTDALDDALGEILSAAPHLAADGTAPKPKGDPDSRKGDPALKGQEELEAMSPEDHAKRKYGSK